MKPESEESRADMDMKQGRGAKKGGLGTILAVTQGDEIYVLQIRAAATTFSGPMLEQSFRAIRRQGELRS